MKKKLGIGGRVRSDLLASYGYIKGGVSAAS
jgi:hypothetical protein